MCYTQAACSLFIVYATMYIVSLHFLDGPLIGLLVTVCHARPFAGWSSAIRATPAAAEMSKWLRCDPANWTAWMRVARVLGLLRWHAALARRVSSKT